MAVGVIQFASCEGTNATSLVKNVGSGLMQYLPLFLTSLRFVLAPAFLVAHKYSGQTVLLFVIVGLAIVTDWLDGFAARRLGVVTVAGKLLDPFADAVFCMAVFVAFALGGFVAWWIVIVLISREAIVTLVLRPMALWRGLVIAASVLGKIKTVLQFCVILLVLVGIQQANLESPVLATSIRLVFYAVILFSLTSLAMYSVRVVAALRERRE